MKLFVSFGMSILCNAIFLITVKCKILDRQMTLEEIKRKLEKDLGPQSIQTLSECPEITEEMAKVIKDRLALRMNGYRKAKSLSDILKNNASVCPLGSGGFGDVFKVAFKTLGIDLPPNYPKFVAVKSFFRLSGAKLEIEFVEKMPFTKYMMTYFGALYGNKEDRVYCFFEFLPGGSLSTANRRTGKGHFSFDVARIISVKILNALYFMHFNKLCHHDIRLGNMCLDAKYNVKLVDFGLSTQINIGTSGEMERNREGRRGTIIHFAPEQVRQVSYDVFQADVFSLGVAFYAMFFGRPAYDINTNRWDKMAQVKNLGPGFNNISSKSEGYSEEVINLLTAMLNPKPYRRPTVLELLEHPLFRDLEVIKIKKGSDLYLIWD